MLALAFFGACLIDTATYERRRAALADDDHDSYVRELDCDDGDASVFPGAPELCDGVDQDCDGTADEDPVEAPMWYGDRDGDGSGGATGFGVMACEAPEGHVADTLDCDDDDRDVYPGAAETPYDGVDDDCDGSDLTDVDGDGGVAIEAGGDDCDDRDGATHVGAAEGWGDDGADNDCDGDAHDPVEWTTDLALTRIDGVAPGGELGRRFDVWLEGDCVFATAPYADAATGAVYAIPAAPGVIRADAAGFVVGSVGSSFLSATVDASAGGSVAVSQVTDRDGAGTVFLLDGTGLCAGDAGVVDSLATLTIRGVEADSYFGSDAVWLDDVNGDGLSELAVTAPGADGGGTGRGALYVWESPGSGTVDSASADLALFGTQDGSGLEVVTTAYDDAGPGVPWVVVGQQVATPGTVGLFVVDALSARSGPLDAAARGGIVTWSTGRLFSATTVGDTDFNGADNLVAGTWAFGLWDISNLDGVVDEADFEALLTHNTDGEWITGVARVDDYDEDARADIVLLADDAPQGTGRGQLALVPGARTFGGSLDFGTVPFTALGGTGESFAYRARPAGDLDGDGVPELAVAAPGASHGAANEGSIYFMPLP